MLQFCQDWLQQMGPPFVVPFIVADSCIGTPPATYAAQHQLVTQEASQGDGSKSEPESSHVDEAAKSGILEALEELDVGVSGVSDAVAERL